LLKEESYPELPYVSPPIFIHHVLPYFGDKFLDNQVRSAIELGNKRCVHIFLKLHERNPRQLQELYHSKKMRVEQFFVIAARKGDLKMMRFLYHAGLLPTVIVFTVAARHGHLNLMRWLKRVQCPWDASTYTALCKILKSD